MKAGAEQKSSQKSTQKSLSSLFDRSSVQLLCLLKTGPSYPRKLAKLVGMRESHVSERLVKLKSAGLVFDRWERIQTSDGFKNVKNYYFNASNIILEFKPDGVEIKLGAKYGKGIDLTLPYFRSEIPRPTNFVGRTKELEMLRNVEGTLVVWGMPGIGKTTLVSQFARSVIAETPIFWHQISEVDSFQYFITKVAIFLNTLGDRRLLDLLDTGLRDERILADTAIDRLVPSRTLVVIDDYHRCRDIGIVHMVESIAERGLPRCIVISRNRIPLPHTMMMKLEGLSEDEAMQLVSASETKPLPDLIKRFGGHPLLLKLVSEFRNTNDIGSTINEFINDTIIANIDEEKLSILLSASVFRGKINRSALDFVAEGVSKGGMLNFLISMERMGILKFIGEEFEIHPLVRQVAYNALASKQAIHRKAAAYYISRGETQDKIEALYHFLKAGENDKAIELLKDQASYIDEGYGSVLFNMLQEFSYFKDDRLASWSFLAKANVVRSLHGDLAVAEDYYERALKLATTSDDRAAKASSLSGLGIVSKELGRLDRAHEYYNEALRTETLDELSKARVMYNAAEAYLEDGRLEDAFELMQKSMNIQEKLKDIRGYFVSKLNINYIRFLKGEYDMALEELINAGKEMSRLGLKSLCGYCDLEIAYILETAEKGEYHSALRHLNLAIENFESSGFRFMLAYTYAERAILHTRMGMLQLAASDVGEAIALSSNLQDRDVLGNVELARAILSAASNDFAESERSFERARELLFQDRVAYARVLAWTGAVKAKKGEKNHAYEVLNQAKDSLEKIGCGKLAQHVSSCISNISIFEWQDFCKQLI